MIQKRGGPKLPLTFFPHCYSPHSQLPLSVSSPSISSRNRQCDNQEASQSPNLISPQNPRSGCPSCCCLKRPPHPTTNSLLIHEGGGKEGRRKEKDGGAPAEINQPRNQPPLSFLLLSQRSRTCQSFSKTTGKGQSRGGKQNIAKKNRRSLHSCHSLLP